MEIRINPDDYNNAVQAVENARARSRDNAGNFDITFGNSDSETISSYGEAIYKLKTCITSHSGCLEKEIAKLYELRDAMEKYDYLRPAK